MVAQREYGQLWTVEQYMEMERQSLIRHELIDGRVYGMSGGDQRHSRIGINVVRALADHLDDGPCQVFNTDMKVRLANERDHLYPDASVSCDAHDLANDRADYIRYPLLVVEIHSESTQRYDRGAKFDLYRGRGTFQEYVLVDTAQIAVEVRSLAADGTWTTKAYGPGDDVVLNSIDLVVATATLYRGIRF